MRNYEKEAQKIAIIFYQDADKGFRQDWFISILNFLEKLPFNDVKEAMVKAIEKGSDDHATFSYFCGICWTKIKGNKTSRMMVKW